MPHVEPGLQSGSRSRVISTLVAAGPTPLRTLRSSLGMGWNVRHNSGQVSSGEVRIALSRRLCVSRAQPLLPPGFRLLTNLRENCLNLQPRGFLRAPGWAGLQSFGGNDDSHRKSVLVSAKIIFNSARVSDSPFWIIDKANQRPAIRVLFILLNINN